MASFRLNSRIFPNAATNGFVTVLFLFLLCKRLHDSGPELFPGVLGSILRRSGGVLGLRLSEACMSTSAHTHTVHTLLSSPLGVSQEGWSMRRSHHHFLLRMQWPGQHAGFVSGVGASYRFSGVDCDLMELSWRKMERQDSPYKCGTMSGLRSCTMSQFYVTFSAVRAVSLLQHDQNTVDGEA
ncbi:hypothetical protein WMY93_022963 [Mugilogobius chulae]|uniref:Uncharacterized protein n=1 Tax=Mugilogobius chulae TaxID=88201 RepID=A0AAW0NDZ8_9GOBI